MSWTSPFTVASTIVPRVAAADLLHERLQVVDGGLHRLRGLEHLGHDELVVVEEAADLVHAPHERAVDDVERGRLPELRVEVLEQPVA